MTHRATFTLDDDAFEYLKTQGGENRSAFINRLLRREKRRSLEESILRANQEEATDAAYQEGIGEWEAVLLDGLAP